ncbi:methyltransferase [bacterium]|nr:methyltransferase [bacterium]
MHRSIESSQGGWPEGSALDAVALQAPATEREGGFDNASSGAALRQMIGGFWISQAIYVAAELGIADLLNGGPRCVEELAAQTHAHAGALYRLLRALASVGVFHEVGESRFALTPLAEGLSSDVEGSQRAFAVVMGAEIYQAWGNLHFCVETGGEAFQKTFGMECFRYFTEHPERGRIFDAAMTGVHGGETEPMLDAYDFSRFESVADVGGGNGLTLAGILQRHPGMTGVLFELPGVAEGARELLARLGLTDRCRIVEGDFFASVPPGCDAYLMRHVIHDWDDAKAEAILSNCRRAMGPEGRVLLVEHVIASGNAPSFGKWLDLMMLVVGGRERTEEQYRRLLEGAGLRLARVVPTAAGVSVLEAVG